MSEWIPKKIESIKFISNTNSSYCLKVEIGENKIYFGVDNIQGSGLSCSISLQEAIELKEWLNKHLISLLLK